MPPSKLIHNKEFREECSVTVLFTVIHPKYGQLCQWIKEWNYTAYFPILFKDKLTAYKWIKEGYISELQEGLTNLNVGFIKGTIK